MSQLKKRVWSDIKHIASDTWHQAVSAEEAIIGDIQDLEQLTIDTLDLERGGALNSDPKDIVQKQRPAKKFKGMPKRARAYGAKRRYKRRRFKRRKYRRGRRTYKVRRYKRKSLWSKLHETRKEYISAMGNSAANYVVTSNTGVLNTLVLNSVAQATTVPEINAMQRYMGNSLMARGFKIFFHCHTKQTVPLIVRWAVLEYRKSEALVGDPAAQANEIQTIFQNMTTGRATNFADIVNVNDPNANNMGAISPFSAMVPFAKENVRVLKTGRFFLQGTGQNTAAVDADHFRAGRHCMNMRIWVPYKRLQKMNRDMGEANNIPSALDRPEKVVRFVHYAVPCEPRNQTLANALRFNVRSWFYYKDSI